MKRTLALFTLLFSLQQMSFAQDKTLVDSLTGEFKIHQQDTIGADILYALSKAHWGADPDKAMDYAKQTLALSEQIDYKKGQGNAYSSMGFITGQKGDYLLALELHKKALKIREEIGDKNGIGGSYGNIGIIFYNQGNFTEALKSQFACLKIKEEIGDKKGMGMTYNNIGIVYSNQGNETEALKNFSACLQIMDELGFKPIAASVAGNIGNIYYNQGHFDEALKNFVAALKIHEETGDKLGISVSYINIGNTYFAQGNYPEALKYQLNAIKISEETGNKDNIAASCDNIGTIYTRQGKYNDASVYLNKALALAKEIGSPERVKTSYHGLAILDSAQGNFKQSLQNYKLFIATRDSMVNNENTKKTVQLQLQYDFDKKQTADSLKFAQEKEIVGLKLQKQKAVTYSSFGGIAITVILLFFVYRNYSKQRLANKQLKAAQEQLIKSEKMAAFGMMASRVSHEIQNPLNFVNNFSELSQEVVSDVIKSQSEDDKKQHAEVLIANLQKIHEHGKRAASIVKQLQEHSDKGTAQDFFETNPN